MVDNESLGTEQKYGRALKTGAVLSETVAHPSAPSKICSCTICEQQIYRNAIQPKFSGYSRWGPHFVEEPTEHQYFICDKEVQAFIFKTRAWGK